MPNYKPEGLLIDTPANRQAFHSLSALLPPTSWARKKSARLPGRDPAISAAEGGTFGAPRRGAKKAVRPQGGKPKPARGGTRS